MKERFGKLFYSLLGVMVGIMALFLMMDPFSSIVDEVMFYGSLILFIGCISFVFLCVMNDMSFRLTDTLTLLVSGMDAVIGILMVSQVGFLAHHLHEILSIWLLIHGLLGFVLYLRIRKAKNALWLMLASLSTTTFAWLGINTPLVSSMSMTTLYTVQLLSLSVTYVLEAFVYYGPKF